jgi:hypothetical protein
MVRFTCNICGASNAVERIRPASGSRRLRLGGKLDVGPRFE